MGAAKSSYLKKNTPEKNRRKNGKAAAEMRAERFQPTRNFAKTAVKAVAAGKKAGFEVFFPEHTHKSYSVIEYKR